MLINNQVPLIDYVKLEWRQCCPNMQDFLILCIDDSLHCMDASSLLHIYLQLVKHVNLQLISCIS